MKNLKFLLGALLVLGLVACGEKKEEEKLKREKEEEERRQRRELFSRYNMFEEIK